jgi:hypothetical protein
MGLLRLARTVTRPAKHLHVVASFAPESCVGEVMDRQRSTDAAATLTAAERLGDPEAATDAPQRRAEVGRVQEAVAAPTACLLPRPAASAPGQAQVDRAQQDDRQGEVRGHRTPLNE